MYNGDSLLTTIDYRYLNNHIVENFDMSKREQEKANEDDKKMAEEAMRIEAERDATHNIQEIGQQQRLTTQQFQKSIHESLDDTKNNISESIDEGSITNSTIYWRSKRLAGTSITINKRNGIQLY